MAIGYSIVVARHGTVFLADTAINETPSPEQLATIAKQMARNARTMGHEPRVAFVSFSNFGSREIDRIDRIRKAIRMLDAEKVDFEYDGEMQADMALDYELLKSTYPFTRLTGPANVLVMPGLHSAHISSRLMQKPGRRHGDRPGDRRPRQAGADRADGRDRQRSRQPRSARRLWRAQPKEVVMTDLVIRGATVVDGLGHEPRRADVAVKDGKIDAIGDIKDKGTEDDRRRRADAGRPASSTCTRTTTRR